MATVGIKGLKYEGPMLKHLSGNTKESGSKSKDIPMQDKVSAVVAKSARLARQTCC